MARGHTSFLRQLHTPKQWAMWVAVALVLLVWVPIQNLAVPEGAPAHLPNYLIPLFGKFLCFVLLAIAMDLIWGYAGILSLGQTVFFALGGYAMGMYLMRSIGTEGVYRSELPDFMVFLDWKELPWFWRPFDNFGFAAFAALAVPGLFAFVFGYLAFRSKIRGVYLSIITQALTYAMMLLMFRNNTGFGGNNGLTDFKRVLDYPLSDQSTKVALYALSGGAALLGYLLCRYVVTSKLGRVLLAIRDQEGRVTFAGYNPVTYKLFVWTTAAVLSGLAGALYVPQVGIINPSELQPANAIEIAIWCAVGGRGTLFGAAIGAVTINGLKSYLTNAYPDAWLFVLGGLFVVVTLFFPAGIVGILRSIRQPRGKSSGAGNGTSSRAPASDAVAEESAAVAASEPESIARQAS
ncbi:MAG TPA: urea ABC transporter permease subunit UrtC [Polyangiales bacterium]|nr:urea ABC transporter permease subunit UrtC [Polyangiales bacterium]